jgi:tetratricopeptide (TPR) repeat protein
VTSKMSMMRWPAFASALVAATAVALAPAHAQPEGGAKPSVSDSDRSVARRHFERGKELHAAGKYQEAATEYLAAYDRFPAPAFLYNVAQVYRLAGDKQNALENYRKYLAQEPDGEGSADAREFVATLEAQLAAESSGNTDQAQPPIEDVGTRPDPIDPIPAPGAPDADLSGTNPGRGKRITGLVVGAAGVVGIGVSVAFALKARSATDDLDAYEGPWTDEQQGIYDDGQAAERTSLVAAAVGGGALVTGAILYYLGSREARRATELRHRNADMVSDLPSPRFQLGAALTDHGGFVLVRGAF